MAGCQQRSRPVTPLSFLPLRAQHPEPCNKPAEQSSEARDKGILMQSSWRRGGPKKNTGGHRKMKPQPKSASFKMLRDPPPQEPRPPCRAASIRRRCRSRTTSSSRRSTRERAGEGKYKHHTAPNSTSPSHACKLCLPLSFCSSLSLSLTLLHSRSLRPTSFNLRSAHIKSLRPTHQPSQHLCFRFTRAR